MSADTRCNKSGDVVKHRVSRASASFLKILRKSLSLSSNSRLISLIALFSLCSSIGSSRSSSFRSDASERVSIRKKNIVKDRLETKVEKF